VHFEAGDPIVSWSITALVWLGMVTTVGYLMVSTWRFLQFQGYRLHSHGIPSG